MILPINGVIIVVLGLLIFVQARQASQSARNAALQEAEQMAHRYASAIQSRLDDAMTTTRLTAETFEGMKATWVDDRGLLNGILSQILTANTNLLAVWSCWEPDALDGKDKSFVGKSGYDKTGRFIPLWYRGDSGVQLEKLTGYEADNSSSCYIRARASAGELLFEPTRQKVGKIEVFATTLTVPVRYNGEVLAVVASLVSMDHLQAIVDSIHPFDSGWACLIAANGRYVAHPQKQQLGQELSEAAAREAVTAGRVYTQTAYSPERKTEIYEILVPIHVGQSKEAWSLAVNLPMNKILAESRRSMVYSILLGLTALVITTLVVTWLARSISRPLNVLAADLNEATDLVHTTAIQMESSSVSLSDQANNQAASIEETSASLEEMAAMTQRNAEHAAQTYELAKQVREDADKSVISMREMQQATAEITESSNNIAAIIKTIDEIAFQTNILSLNAAVEAARAGDAGLGFAVVAQEVRNLAQRSAEAAKETAQKIEESISRTSRGVQVTKQVGDALQNIVNKVRQMDELVASIVQASKEQSLGINQMNIAMGEMDRTTQDNAAQADRGATCAQNLKTQADELRDDVRHLTRLISGEVLMQGAEDGAHDVKPVTEIVTADAPAPGHDPARKLASKPQRLPLGP